MKINITPTAGKRIGRFLLLAVLLLTCLSLAGQFAKYYLGNDTLKGFVPVFYVDYESNVPTWWSSFALCFAASLLALIATVKVIRHDRFRWHWCALSVLFLLLSLDEVAMIHEYPIAPMRRAFDARGVLYYPWVLLGAGFVVVVGLAFLRFLLHLPRRTRNGCLLAAATFVGGAICVEMASGLQADLHGEENFTYAMIVSLEEFMEMIGVVIFIRTLLKYWFAEIGEIEIVVGSAASFDRTSATPHL